MIYKPNFFNSPGNGETKFRNSLESVLRGQGWHVQIFEDRQRKGIPDISAANGLEAWLELKVAKKIHSVHDYLHLDHELTAQQHRWLLDRQTKSPASACGVVVAWRTGPAEGPQEYVTFVPIREWRGMVSRQILMKWGLNRHTAKLTWLYSGEAQFLQVARGELTPGWGGRPVGAAT